MSGDFLPIAVGIILVAAAASFVLLPFARGARGRPMDFEGDATASTERFAIYRRVLELEFDRDLGKLSDEDYASQSAELLSQAGQVLRAERGAVGELDAEIEREILAARSAFAAARSETRKSKRKAEAPRAS